MLATLRQRNFALLWFGGLVSLTGDWMLFVALPIHVYDVTGSTLATGVMFAARLLPDALFGSVAGVFVDRWDRRRTMIFVNLLMALSMLPLLIVPPTGWLWIVYAAAFAEVSAGAFLRPAENALLPRLVGAEHLMAANSLNALNNNLARLVGPALGGVAVLTLGLGGVALLNAVSFVVVAAMIRRISGDYRAAGRPMDAATAAAAFAGVWREWVEGLGLLRGGLLPTIFAVGAIMGIGEGIMAALFVPFVEEVLNAGPPEVGWLVTAQAVGGVAGGLIVGSVTRAMPPALLLGVSAVAFGLIDLTIFNYPAFLPGIWLGMALFVVVGLPSIGVRASMNTLLQGAVADQHLGRIFGAFNTTQALSMLAGALLGWALGGVLGIVLMLNVEAGSYVLAGLLVLVVLSGRAGKTAADRPRG